LLFIAFATYYLYSTPSKPAKNNVSPTPKTETFKYDAAKAQTLLFQYIKSTIKPDVISADFDSEQIPQSNQDASNFLINTFSAREASISAFFRYEKNADTINSYSVSVEFDSIPSATGASLANSLFALYFVNPPTISSSECKQTADATFCENFQTASDGKRGFAMTLFGKPPRVMGILSVCFIPEESKSFVIAKSCVIF
jgi:hypothetical protein